MKKVAIALGALTFGSVGHAQSSVTLYGIADTGVTINSNSAGGRQYALTSGNFSGDRVGFRGIEDLGAGWSTLFVLEAGYNGSTGAMGQNGTFFGRQAYVGVSSGTAGTVTLGRQYPTVYDFVGPFASGADWAAAGTGYGAHPADVDNLDSFNRTNNTIKFSSVPWYGMTLGAMYSFGGKAGGLGQNQIWGVSLGYAVGPFKLAAGYQTVNTPNFSFWGSKANDSNTGSNMSSPVISGYATAGTEDIFAAGGSYKLGSATLALVYSNTRFKDLSTVAVTGLGTPKYVGQAAFNSYEANLKYLVTPALQVGVAFAFTRNAGASGFDGASYRQINAGLDYFLSKRTDLYALLVHQRATGTDSTGRKAVAAIAGTSASTSNAQTVGVFGMRHKF